MTGPARPSVSVVTPFSGTKEEAGALVEELRRIATRPGDELIVADNSPDQVLAGPPPVGVTVVAATLYQSSYYARNVGAERTENDWILFMDADCRPSTELLDRYFAEPVDDSTGAVAGEVVGAPGQDGLVVRYARSRRHLSQADGMRHPYRPLGVTANLLVRRAAWSQVGGFLEGIRSGGDTDFCWRIQDRGWEMEYRARATVEHRHRENLRGLMRQMARYGAGRAWLARRHPGSRGRPAPIRGLARCAVGSVAWLLCAHPERAAFKLLDAASIAAEAGGYLMANMSRRPELSVAPGRAPGLDIVVLCDVFPELSETFIVAEAHALQAAGHRVRIEAWGRSRRPNRQGGRGLEVSYREDDGIAGRLRDLAWLARRHPLRCAGDLAARLRWRRNEEVRPLAALAPCARRLVRGGERHLHVHFAAAAALDALRLSRLLGIPYSLTAHAYDVFQHPRNLHEKIRSATFTTTGCQYNVRYLRELVPERANAIHEIVMGVDGGEFQRATPYPGGRSLLAVGRLVEKKGFADLIDAVARLEAAEPVAELQIVGEGSLRPELEERIRSLGLEHRVRLLGARDPEQVKALLGEADVLAMPCVVAADGDRDSMPVVVKEALAMEVPVVATDEVGLPEVVQPGCGRLVPPGDAAALATSLAELLALPAEERAAMGRAGREFVLRHCSVARETEKLAALIAASATAPGSASGGPLASAAAA